MATAWKKVIEALDEKGQQGDDLDWESFNKERCVVAGRWKVDKLLRKVELKKDHGVRCMMIYNKVIGVDILTRRRSFFVANVQRKLFGMVLPLQFHPFFTGPRSFNFTDVCIAPYSLFQGPNPHPMESSSWPRVVVQVGECATLPELFSYGHVYFNTPNSQVQVYVAVKYYPANPEQMVVALLCRDSAGGTAISFGKQGLSRATELFLRSQGVELSGVGYGGRACDALGMPEYELKIPTAKFYHNLGDPPADLPVELTVVDLYAAQTCFTDPQHCKVA